MYYFNFKLLRGLNISYSIEKQAMGTASGVKKLKSI